jgi:hypothetical protein
MEEISQSSARDHNKKEILHAYKEKDLVLLRFNNIKNKKKNWQEDWTVFIK